MTRFFARTRRDHRNMTSGQDQVHRSRKLTPRGEALEGRQLLTGITDMTDLARVFPTHSGPTSLYLAFDGFSIGQNTVARYEGAFGGNRDESIQEVVFRTAELFAPFNVQVRRATSPFPQEMFQDGATTIAIGDTPLFATVGGVTPGAFADGPSGTLVQPNSHPFDIAYVDPVFNGDRSQDWGLAKTIQAVAHEAGHTFGLAHVRAVGTDPTPVVYSDTNTPDVMSYDSPNTVFRNQTLQLTGANFDPVTGTSPIFILNKPWWDGSGGLHVMETQNSYTYLRVALGHGQADDFADVAHRDAVDAGYSIGTIGDLDSGPLSGTIGAEGDYDVFRSESFALDGTTQQLLRITVEPTSGSTLDPVLFVYNSDGTLAAFNDNRSSGSRSSEVVFTATTPNDLRVVVGAANGLSSGGYTVRSALIARYNTAARKLTVEGTPSADVIRITCSYPETIVDVNGVQGTFQTGSVPEIAIHAGGGDDRLILDLSANVSRTYEFGTQVLVSYNTGPTLPIVAFDGVEHVELYGSDQRDIVKVDDLPGAIGDLTIQARKGDDAVSVTRLTSWRWVAINGAEGADSVTVSNAASGAVSFIGGPGNTRDSLVVDDRSSPSGGTYTLQAGSLSRSNAGNVQWLDCEDLLVQAGPGADSLAVNQMPANMAVTFDGGTETDTLRAANNANNWNIQDLNRGNVNGAIAFVDVEDLLGGAERDTFVFANGKGVSGMIDGGPGLEDRLEYTSYGTAVLVDLQAGTATGTGGFRNIEAVSGGSSRDTLTGKNVNNSWWMSANNAGSVAWVETSGSFTFSRSCAFAGFEVLNGGNSSTQRGAVDKLIATDANNTWDLTGAKAGKLNGSLTFTGMEDMKGGAGRDTFLFAAGVGHDGSGGGGTGASRTGLAIQRATGTVYGLPHHGSLPRGRPIALPRAARSR